MSAHYDTYDYPSYWKEREYEHNSETIAIKSFLNKIPKIQTLIELGAGYGRLTPSYIFRAKKIILVDSSLKLIKIARENIKNKKVIFIQSRIENVGKKIKKESCDLVVLVRVLHHIEDVNLVFSIINQILKHGGYFILEFANKRNLKATIRNFIKGDFTFPLEIFPKDLRCKKNIKKGTIPFKNYHPDSIKKLLAENKFKIIEVLSVSNFRSPFLKRILSLNTCLYLEKFLQKPLARFYFGPSIFILAKKQ